MMNKKNLTKPNAKSWKTRILFIVHSLKHFLLQNNREVVWSLCGGRAAVRFGSPHFVRHHNHRAKTWPERNPNGEILWPTLFIESTLLYLLLVMMI